MRIENPTPSELRYHQIAYYTMLLKESKSDDQKRFLRTQLYNLKKSDHVSLHPIGGIPDLSASRSTRNQFLGEKLN